MSKNLVPRINGESSVGRSTKWWASGWFTTLFTSTLNNTVKSVTVGHLWQATKNVLFTETSITVQMGATTILDTIKLSDADTGKWLLRANLDTDIGVSEFIGHIGRGGAPSWSQYACLGDRLACSFFIDTDGTNLLFKVTNSSVTHVLVVRYKRIAI